jgi:hypothetical protein
MEKYIGVKLIEAEPMNLGDYNKFKGWAIPENEDPKTEGYKVKYSDDYISWSPKEVFEEAYRTISNMTFGLAVEAVKKGMKIARKGWNGKGMYVYYVPGGDYKTQTEVAKKEFGETAHYNPYLAIKTVTGAISTWVPSINDTLAEDWEVLK